jgi:predicted nucleotidyltransferase
LVLVFGSRARGEALAESDLDLLVVSDRFAGVGFLDRAWRLLADLDLPFGADILCYTPAEFARKRREHGIVSRAVEEGVTLWPPVADGARATVAAHGRAGAAARRSVNRRVADAAATA